MGVPSAPGPAVATGGFASSGATARRMRPAYARASIGELKAAIGTAVTVVDVAAATGILAGQLHRAGMAVVAVESVPEMLAQLRRSLPAVAATRALADALPFANSTVEAVVVDAALHGFDARRALVEAARVIRPGGVLAVVSNRRDSSVDWVRRFGEIIVSARSAEWPDERDLDWEASARATGAFGPHERSDHPNPQPSSPSALVHRAASTRIVAGMTPAARGRVLDQVGELTATHPDLSGRDQFDLPCRTEVQLWRRRG